jgi:general secretion pathway protein G
MCLIFQERTSQAAGCSLREPCTLTLLNQSLMRTPHSALRIPHSAFRSSKGLTLVELIATVTIISILAMGALPLAKISIKRQKELELRRALREMREAIDRYKDAADHNFIEVKLGTDGYPPDLETLVKGVTQVNSTDKKLRFLRRIPIDPMTGKAEWAMRSSQDSPDSTSFGGQNVYDVYSKSAGTALDESKYSDW